MPGAGAGAQSQLHCCLQACSSIARCQPAPQLCCAAVHAGLRAPFEGSPTMPRILLAECSLAAGSPAQSSLASTHAWFSTAPGCRHAPVDHSKTACVGRMLCKGYSQLRSATGPRPPPAGQYSPVSSAWAACRAPIQCQLSRALELRFGGAWWPGPTPSSWTCMPTPCATRCLLLAWDFLQAGGGCASKAGGWLAWSVVWLHEQVGMRLRHAEEPAAMTTCLWLSAFAEQCLVRAGMALVGCWLAAGRPLCPGTEAHRL